MGLNTRLQRPRHADESWDWAVNNGRLMRVAAPDGSKFDVLLLGAADYVAVNLDKSGRYNVTAPLRLFSVNGEFRHWVEAGCQGPIRGVRWEVTYERDGLWRVGTDIDMLA